MPQFDTFIFSSSLFYFIISFLVVLYGNQVRFLPYISGILKLRNKVSQQSNISKNKDTSLFEGGLSYNTIVKE